MKITTKTRIPPPNRKGCRWLRRGERVRDTDAYQYSLDGKIEPVMPNYPLAVGRISDGPIVFLPGKPGGYIRRIKRAKRKGGAKP